MIALGATEISKVCLGSDELNKVCLGSTELWSAASQLPYDAEVEYIECTGTQWINTGISLGQSNDISAYIECKTGQITNERAILGNSGGDYIEICFLSGEVQFWNLRNKIARIQTSTSDKDFIIRGRMTPSSVSIEANGETNTIEVAPSVYANRILTICRHNSKYNFIGKIKAIKLNINGAVVADYIPVRLGQVGYLYDKVTKEMFGSASSDAFLPGNDK